MYNSISEIITDSLSKTKNNICFAKKKHGEWIYFTKENFIETSNNIAYGLINKGVKKGDNIVIISENTPEWNYVDFALLKIGAVSVPAYITISDNQLEIILKETEAKIIFVSNKYLFRKAKQISTKLDTEIKIYSFDKIENEESIYELADYGNKNQNKEKLSKIEKSISPDDIYSILYTSGTARTPKGVMLNHKGQINIINNVLNRTNIIDGEISLHYLPLSNSYGRFVNYISQISGMTIYYINGIGKLQQITSKVKPHFIATTPLLLEQLMTTSLNSEYTLSSELKEKFNVAKEVISNYKHTNNFYTKKEYLLSEKTFFNQWKIDLFGGNIKTIFTGGALISKDVHNFFKCLKINVISGYGLTETSGLLSIDSTNKETKPKKCGTLLTNMKVIISDQGEILAKGVNIMEGYYKHENITNETIDKDGWLHTGDTGTIDKDGYIEVKGRIKSTFKLIGGEYVYPELIEERLNKNIYISNSIIAGLGQKYVIALIVPDFEIITEWAKSENIEFSSRSELINNKNIVELFDNIIMNGNSILHGNSERVEQIKLVLEDWTLESGLITENRKINRNLILERYSKIINNLFKE